MDLNADVQTLVRELADREAIRSLPQRYCDCIWRKDYDGLARLFTEQCVLDLGAVGHVLSSPQQIRETLGAGVGGEGARANPFIHNQVFELHGDRATGRSYLEVHVTQDGKTRTGVGFYEEEFGREKGRWKFRMRRARFLTPPRD